MSRHHVIKATGTATDSQNRIRIVHISDTHQRHDELIQNGCIPDGDILVHSGDFLKNKSNLADSPKGNCLDDILAIDSFFKCLPHKHKIFVAGNHEVSIEREDPKWVMSQFKNCIYLQDSSVVLHGIKFYGTPWTGSRADSSAHAFTAQFDDLHKFWSTIPDEVDVLITHSPPYCVMDLGLNAAHRLDVEIFCKSCDVVHVGMSHFGCRYLKNEITQRIRPRLHLFGHAHEGCGTQLIDGILFSNAATPVLQVATVVDFYI